MIYICIVLKIKTAVKIAKKLIIREMKSKIYNVAVLGYILDRQSISRSEILAKFDIEFDKRRAIKKDEVLQEIQNRYPEIIENSVEWDVVEAEYRCNGLLNTVKYIHMGGYIPKMNQ